MNKGIKTDNECEISRQKTNEKELDCCKKEKYREQRCQSNENEK